MIEDKLDKLTDAIERLIIVMTPFEKELSNAVDTLLHPQEDDEYEGTVAEEDLQLQDESWMYTTYEDIAHLDVEDVIVAEEVTAFEVTEFEVKELCLTISRTTPAKKPFVKDLIASYGAVTINQVKKSDLHSLYDDLIALKGQN